MGRPPRISRAAVVDAVLEIGLDRATIAEVAARLGVDPSTLYGHVRGRDDMLAAAADTALARAPWPPADDGDWRSYLTSLADGLWELYSRTPGLALHLRATTSVVPTLVARSTEVVTTLCERFGFVLFDAALLTDAVGDTVIDSYLTVAAFDGASEVAPGQRARDATAGALGGAAPGGADVAGAPGGAGMAGAPGGAGVPGGEGHDNDDDTRSRDRRAGGAHPEGIATAYLRLLAHTIGDPHASDRWWRQKVQLVLDGQAYRMLQGGAGN